MRKTESKSKNSIEDELSNLVKKYFGVKINASNYNYYPTRGGVNKVIKSDKSEGFLWAPRNYACERELDAGLLFYSKYGTFITGTFYNLEDNVTGFSWRIKGDKDG